MSERNEERGFTLVEVLVTVLILGLLAAVVFPVVIPQISKADPTKASNDLANIRTGIELFQLDVRPTTPGDVEDLVNPITTADAPVDGGNFIQGQVNKWDGPYVDVSLAEIDVASSSTEPVAVTTGFEAPLLSDLYLVSNASTTTDFTNGEASSTNADFVVIRILDLVETEFEDLNDQIDGEREVDGSAVGESQEEGRLRCDGCDGTTPAATTDLDGDGSDDTSITYFLAVPFKR